METVVIFLLSFLAAFIGTLAMTLGQEIELRVNKRPISHTPAIAVFKILRLNFERLGGRMKLLIGYLVHFGYGTFLGFPLALFYLFDFVIFNPVLLIYYIVVLLQGWIILPLLGISGPVWSWGLKPVLTEMAHKAIYSLVTVIAFFALL